MISVICVYNDEKAMKDCLLKNLERQTAPYEFIGVDNSTRRYKSSAAANNAGAMQAKGKYLAFVHQDIDLMSPTLLADAEKMLDSLPALGIAGVAGVKDEKGIHTNIIHGVPPSNPGQFSVSAPEAMQTVDECLIFIPKEVFSRLQFDEVACDDWHLFAAEYSLSCKKLGYEAYVLPLKVHHLSTGIRKSVLESIKTLGPVAEGYYSTLEKIAKKHKNDYPVIFSTCGVWKTSRSIFLQRIAYIIRLYKAEPLRALKRLVSK